MKDEIIRLINERDLPAAFDLGNSAFPNSPEYKALMDEYISGKSSFDFHDRLKIFVNGYYASESRVETEEDDQPSCPHCGHKNVTQLGTCSYVYCKAPCCTECGHEKNNKIVHKKGWCINGINIYNKTKMK